MRECSTNELLAMYLDTLKKSIVELSYYNTSSLIFSLHCTIISIGGIDVLDASHLEELLSLN